MGHTVQHHLHHLHHLHQLYYWHQEDVHDNKVILILTDSAINTRVFQDVAASSLYIRSKDYFLSDWSSSNLLVVDKQFTDLGHSIGGDADVKCPPKILFGIFIDDTHDLTDSDFLGKRCWRSRYWFNAVNCLWFAGLMSSFLKVKYTFYFTMRFDVGYTEKLIIVQDLVVIESMLSMFWIGCKTNHFVLCWSPFANCWSHIITLVLNWLGRISSIPSPQLNPCSSVVARSDVQGRRNTSYVAQLTTTVVYYSQITHWSWLKN